jgi:protein phosphatase
VASRLAAEALAGALGGAAGDLAAPVLLDTARLAIATADAAVRARGAADPALAGLGTTCTAFVVTASAVVVAHAGDSRLYRLRDGVLAACTRDHVAWVPHPDGPARAVLTSCLGVGRVPEVEVHDLTSRVHPGDRYLLATDGLTAALGDTIATDEVVARLLAAPDGDARLVEAALAAGAPDNVSVVRIAIDAV